MQSEALMSEALKDVATPVALQSRRAVYTVGVWDMLHVGHIRSMQAAKALGDYLIVGVHSDEFVQSYKRSPVIPYHQRLECVSALGCVDEVMEGPGSNGLTKEWYDERGIVIHAVSTEYAHRVDAYVPARELGILRFTHSTLFIHTSGIINSLKEQQTNVCIVGGGAAGHLLAGLCGANAGLRVSVLTRRPEEWQQEITVLNLEGGCYTKGKLHRVSSDASIVADADVVILCLPAFARPQVLGQVAPHLRHGAIIGSLPGTGGFDWMAHTLLPVKEKDLVIFGSQRLPFVCRVVQYGDSVRLHGNKANAPVAVIPAAQAKEVCSLLGGIVGVPCLPLSTFLEVSLTPSNPILHPSRMYGAFEGFENHIFENRLLFYEEWDEKSIQILQAMDDEVQQICKVLGCTQVLPLHQSYPAIYGADPDTTLLAMIRGNPSYKGVYTPMEQHQGGWVADFQSRYLTEDVPFGLVLLCVLADICSSPCPMLHKVLLWCQKVIGKEYLVDSALVGKDMSEVWGPGQCGLRDIAALVAAAK